MSSSLTPSFSDVGEGEVDDAETVEPPFSTIEAAFSVSDSRPIVLGDMRDSEEQMLAWGIRQM